MRKVYYNCVPKSYCGLSALVLPLFLAVTVAQSPQTIKGASVDSHDGMTISAEPWTSAEQYKPKFPKNSPISAGVLAIHVSFTNSTDQSIRVGLGTIRLSLSVDQDNRQQLAPLSPDELADIVLRPKTKDPTARARIPLPIPSSGGGRDKKWQELKRDAQEASFQDGVIAPHKTVEGLLYFDLQGQFDLLESAHLYIPDLTALETNHELLYFDLDLSHTAQR